jgi:hypothetical protein
MRGIDRLLQKPLLAAALLAVACATASPLKKDDFAAAGIREGSGKATVRRMLGAPASMRDLDAPPGVSVWSYPGLQVAFSPTGNVSTIRITGSRFETPRGLRPGDEPQKVLNAHGSPYRLNGKVFVPDIHAFPPPHTGDTWTYCEPRDPVCDHAIFVAFDAQGRISSITLGLFLPVG